MRGILLGACLLVSNVILAQCSFLSLDVCGPYIQGGPTCGEINVSCPGASDGSATASSFVWPASGSVSYQWIGNGDTLYGASVNNLAAGSYEVQASSSQGCSSSVFITVSEPLIPTINVAVDDVSCFALNDGQAIVSVLGDEAPYTIDFGTENPNQLFAGVHVFDVIDANACVFQDSVEVFQPAEIQIQHQVLDVDCYGENSGEIELTVLSPGDFSYNWSTGDSSQDVSSLFAGVYNVTVTDSTNCSKTINDIEVTQSSLLQLNVVPTDVSCASEQDGVVAVSVLGGSPPYNYNYFGENPFALSAGQYAVEVTDSLLCTTSTQYTISEPLALSVNINSLPVSCFNGDDGGAIVTSSGGVQPYVVNWYGEDETALMAGSYSVSVIDANNCVVDTSVIVVQPDSLFASFTAADVSCFAMSDGYIEIDTVVGGIAPYSLLWATGSDTLLTAASYAVLLTDANGCAFSDTITVNQPDSLEVLVSITDALCYGDSTGSASLSVLGGVQPYTVDWLGVDPTMLPVGTYSFLVSDANACVQADSIQINQPSDLDFTAITDDVSCYGLSDGRVEVSVVGGQAPYSFNFAGLDTANLQAGLYTVFVLDANLCQDSLGFQITEPDSLYVSVTTTDVSCYSFSDGSVSLNIQGGTGLYTENWNGFDSNNLAAGQYTFEVFDENNCSFVDSVIVNEPDSLFAETTIVDASCFGFNDGSVQINSIGGVAPYQIDWAGEDSMALGAGNYIFTITDSKGCLLDVSVFVSESDEILIESAITDVACYGGSAGEISLTLVGGLSPYNYMWSNGVSASVNSGLSAGLYDVLVTDDMGCEQYKSMEVSQPDSIQLVFDVQLESCTGIGDGALEAVASGGVMPYLVQWSNGVEGWNLNNVEAGLYSLTLIDANGCFSEDTVSMFGEESCFLLPTLFTPNNDGFNDTWNIQGMKKYPEAEVKVFTRSGKLVFEQTGYASDWDGSYKGMLLPKGDYYYYLDLKDGSEVLQGVVTIKR